MGNKVLIGKRKRELIFFNKNALKEVVPVVDADVDSGSLMRHALVVVIVCI
jgi:hypothetical protein